eukprot:CAMPEP_0119120616 /NCGR_PEP_ID=MMETSP1310-20130426/1581_1 /TAXON_ID=464262 /ORGANISM="Genus nov. species nov., Strain RCC2339" /LENGTH=213 /DNA_ID=CAMNT_0007110103 /DNA_START=157 /DNA_END=794 /DNA_ORIENTATION=+
MIHFTFIARISDSLILCGVNSDGDSSPKIHELGNKAKQILRKVTPDAASPMCLETPQFYFMYILADGVCFLTLFDRDFPKRLATKFLLDVSKEFLGQHAADVPRANRPFEMIQFDLFIRRTKKVYMNTASSSGGGASQVTEDIGDIHRTMTRTLNDILERGEKLNSISTRSEMLFSQSEKYRSTAHDLKMSVFYNRLKLAAVVLGSLSLVLFL